MAYMNVPTALKILWEKKYFLSEKTFKDISTNLSHSGINPTSQTLQMALIRAKYLITKGVKGKYKYIQKYASDEITLNNDVLPEELIKALGKNFDNEINDLRINFSRSGTCTAFLLRKILEKLIFLAFAKQGLSDKLKASNGGVAGLKTMLSMSTIHKVHGKPFLMAKTAKEIEGIKFLGDTSAHNPLVNVHMRTIIPQMPYLVTAYDELSKKL